MQENIRLHRPLTLQNFFDFHLFLVSSNYIFNSDQPKVSPSRRQIYDEKDVKPMLEESKSIQRLDQENTSPGDYYNYSIKKKSGFDDSVSYSFCWGDANY